jgi:hypothetical protein
MLIESVVFSNGDGGAPVYQLCNDPTKGNLPIQHGNLQIVYLFAVGGQVRDGEAPSPAREGACAPQTAAQRPERVQRSRCYPAVAWAVAAASMADAELGRIGLSKGQSNSNVRQSCRLGALLRTLGQETTRNRKVIK